MGHRVFFAGMLLLSAAIARADSIESPDSIRTQVETFLQTALRNEYVGIQPEDLEVAVGNLDSRLRLSQCQAPLRQEIATARPYGSNLTVKVSCSTPEPWSIYVPARVQTYAEVAVVVRALPRGAVLSADDVMLKRTNTSQGGSGLIQELPQVIGQELKRRLDVGEPVRLSHLKAPQVIRKGDKVILEASTGGISVVTSGTALANGQVGDQIQVRNEKSKRVVDAEVIAPGKARVAL
jgi:flagella basal body P-ring formation protein FlgA